MNTKNLLYLTMYFVFSSLLTWIFIKLCPIYISNDQMILSGSIAGGKWAIQILLAILILKKESSRFIRIIGRVCFIGSCILIPYIFSALINVSNAASFFVWSLVVSVIVMIFYYYKAVKQMKVSQWWWFFWLFCLALAITLQLTVVF